jgi:hypothetical protein
MTVSAPGFASGTGRRADAAGTDTFAGVYRLVPWVPETAIALGPRPLWLRLA